MCIYKEIITKNISFVLSRLLELSYFLEIMVIKMMITTG